jgi:ADP-heptose:LPS heptosyltransferase
MNQWDLVAPLGIPPLDPSRDPVQMPENLQASGRVETLMTRATLGPEHTLIVIHVSASTRFKRWPEESFVSLIVELVRRDASRRIALISGPSDTEATQRISGVARTLLDPVGSALLDVPSLSLPELRALVTRASLYVGGDSGPLHIAATTGVPIVELLGPTLAERSSPWRHPHWFTEIIEPGALPCRPCHQRVCVPGDFRCLTSLGPDRVIAAAERALRWSSQSSQKTAPETNERRIPVVH